MAWLWRIRGVVDDMEEIENGGGTMVGGLCLWCEDCTTAYSYHLHSTTYSRRTHHACIIF